jgi:hypothetical protein
MRGRLMARVLANTVWVDGKEYLGGSTPPADVAAGLADHLWVDVESPGSEPAAADPNVDRLATVAEAAYDTAVDVGRRWRAVVTALLAELGQDAPAAPEEWAPEQEEQGPSQFEAVPVTEGGPAVEPAEDLPPAGTVDEGAPESPTPAEAEPAASLADDGDQDVQPAEPVDVEVPNRGGKGSSKAHWLEYARAKGVEVTDDMERHEVIAACEAAGVPVD